MFIVQVVDTPMLPTKFLYLKHLTICLRYGTPPPFDYFSLVSFLDASPSLETLILHVSHCSLFHPAKISGHSVGPINSMSLSFSGRSRTYGASSWFGSWTFLTSEAAGRTPLLLLQECEDHKVQLCEEPSWTNMSYPQERSATRVSYIGHPLWF